MKTWLRNLYEDRFFLFIPGFIYLCLAAALLYVIVAYPREVIEGVLTRWVPCSLRINFFLLLMGAYCCRHDVVQAFSEVASDNGNGTSHESPFALGTFPYRRRKALLLIILVAAALLTVSFAPVRTHRIYFDEDIYANIGQNIAHTGQSGMCNYGTFEYGEYSVQWLQYNKEPSGWPFLISLAFQLFGTNEIYAFILNNLIYALSILFVFFLTWMIGKRYSPAFLAALVFALIPHNLIWSNTAAAEPAAALFTGFVVLCFIVYLRTQEIRHLFLLSVALPFACQVRPESALIIPWLIAAALVLSRSSSASGVTPVFARKEVWTMGVLTAIFLLPHILHTYAVSGNAWGAEGVTFSPAFFDRNLAANGPYYLNNRDFPVLFTALAALGLLPFGKALRWRLIVALWFLLFWGIFLFFYAGSYQYGADVRFAVVSFMPLSILAGLGGGAIRDAIPWRDTGVLIAATVLAVWISFLPLIRAEGQEAWGARYDHYYARTFLKKVPRRSVILTHIPTMFLLWQQSAIQTYAGINNPDVIRHLMTRYGGEVYFHYNYWCNTAADKDQRLCQMIRERYDLEEVASGKEQNFVYALYKMRFKALLPVSPMAQGQRGGGGAGYSR